MSPVPLARHKSGPSNETAKTKAQCHNRPSASLQPFTSNCDVSISKREVKQCPNEQSILYIMTGDGLRSSLICKQGHTIECNNLLSQQICVFKNTMHCFPNSYEHLGKQNGSFLISWFLIDS